MYIADLTLTCLFQTCLLNCNEQFNTIYVRYVSNLISLILSVASKTLVTYMYILYEKLTLQSANKK